MPDLGSGLLGCYRCGYVWRLRKSPVRICPRCKSRLWDVPRLARTAGRGRPGLGISEVVGRRREELVRIAFEYGATQIRVFGSVARGEARTDSDIDLLVTFHKPVGLLRKLELKERAEKLLARPVDLATEGNLHWRARPQILAEAVPL